MDPTQSPEPADPFVATFLSRGLRLLERLGETPAGRVYRAQYFSAEPSVVVVVLNASSGPRPRFATSRPAPEVLAQLQHASRIRHPNVAGVRELCETTEGVVYAVMEAIPGELLSEVVAARGALPLQEAVDLVLQAGAGLRAAHAVGVVHGNLSPDTLVVSEGPDGSPIVKLVGFTPAALGPGEAPGPSAAAFGAAFTSPEQLDGGAPDTRGDVFSLGAVLSYMLTGAPPTDGPLLRSIPKHVRSVLSDALAQSPVERFQTVDEFGDALQEAMTRLPAMGAGARGPRMLATTLVVLALLAGLWWMLGPKVAIHLPTLPMLGRHEAGAPTEGRSDVPRRPEPRRPLPKPSTEAAVETADAPGGRQLESGAVRSSDTRAASQDDTAPVKQPVKQPARRQPPAQPDVALSPFRRAHPWAALPDGRFYFRSSCTLALRAPELIYFDSEVKAQATGREKSTVLGCS